MSLFEIEKLSKSFPQRGGEGTAPIQVLHDISLAVEEGEILAVAGPSGSGKSTLLRMLNALDDPNEGVVRFDGKDLTEWDVVELRRQVAMLFQLPSMFPGSVRRNLTMPLGLRDGRGAHPEEERYRELLAGVGLDGSLLDRTAENLSVGQQQRVAFARAMVLGPRAILLDEPTANLDPATARGFLKTLAGYEREHGLTSIMVTHQLEQARGIADRIVLLVDGRIVADQPAEEFFTAPANETAERFLRGELEGKA